MCHQDLCRTPECLRLVTVCKACKMAACWRGIFMCDDAKGADIERLPVWRLRELGLEHSDYYAASDDYPEPSDCPLPTVGTAFDDGLQEAKEQVKSKLKTAFKFDDPQGLR